MRSVTPVSELKVRASWGRTGNQAFANYQQYPNYVVGGPQVQYQFGDTDGFWAAVLRYTAERRANLFAPPDTSASLRERVSRIIDTLYDGLTNRDSRAIENLRAVLPRDYAELERLYPQTAAELFSWGQGWQETCQKAFADLRVDPQRVREIASLIPGAMRGIASEKQLGTYADLDEARCGLTNAIVAYLDDGRG